MLPEVVICVPGVHVGKVLWCYGFLCLHFRVCTSVGSVHHLEVGVDVAVVVSSWIRMVADREGRSQVADGLFDCTPDQWAFVSGSSVLPSANDDCKAPDQAEFFSSLNPK